MRASFPEELTTNFVSLLVPLWRSWAAGERCYTEDLLVGRLGSSTPPLYAVASHSACLELQLGVDAERRNALCLLLSCVRGQPRVYVCSTDSRFDYRPASRFVSDDLTRHNR